MTQVGAIFPGERKNMKFELRKFIKKAALITAVSAAYSLWLWKDAGKDFWRLCSDVTSVIGLVFLVIGVFSLVHNLRGLVAFTYSFRYVGNMIRNVRNRDAATDETIPGYVEYRNDVETWKNAPLYLIAAALFTGISLVTGKL